MYALSAGFLRGSTNKERINGKTEKAFASSCFLAFPQSESPVWTFTSAAALHLILQILLVSPKATSLCLLNVQEPTSLCVPRCARTSWVTPAPLRSDSQIFGNPSATFWVLKNLCFSSSVDEAAVISCIMIQCFTLSAFNICLTDVLYVLSAETPIVGFVFLTGSWLIYCFHRFPSKTSYKI